MDAAFKPRRLLNVGGWDRDPFLFEPTTPLSYVALSYCWGSNLNRVMKTSKSTLKSFHNVIRLFSLPQTVRDAILFCRGVKVKYLWVDSLCIVQDDEEEWFQESAQMRHIYSNSHFTIAAHKPKSCKSGFLGMQRYSEPSWSRYFHTNLGQRGNSKARMVATPKATPDNATYFEDERSALEERGWTLQESILPTRILHFTGNEMAWECNKTLLCECGHMEHGRSRFRFLKSDFKSRGQWLKDNHGLTDGWRTIVMQYSTRKLTNQDDKLVAISGLAQMFMNSGTSQKVQGECAAYYLAGIWREGLPEQLLWHAKDRWGRLGGLPHTRPLKYCAPTWSWASLDGPVLYGSTIDELSSEITISESFCHPVSPLNPTGPVKSGYLVVTGLLAPVQIITATAEADSRNDVINDAWRSQTTLVRGENLFSYEISSDLPRTVNIRTGDRCYDCWMKRKHDSEICSDCFFVGGQALFYCLKVASSHKDSGNRVYYLALTRSPSIPDAYERVGIGIYNRMNWQSEGLKIRLFENAEMTTIKIV